MVQNNKRIAKNTLYLYMRMVVVMFVSIYTSRVVLEALGIVDYGVYNVVGGIVTMMSFINAALSVATSRNLTYELGLGDRERLNKTFAASLNLHICVAIATFILAESLGLWFFYEKLVIPADRMIAAFWVYQFSIITTMLTFTQVPYSASLISHEDMSIYAYLGLYESISKLGIAYLIIISPIDKLIFYGFLIMLNSAIVQIFLRFYTMRKYEECHFMFITDKNFYKPLLSYSCWNLVGGLSYVVQGQGINLLLNTFFGPVVNAARGVTNQIQSALLQFTNNFLTAVRPQIVKDFAREEFDDMYRLTFKSGKFCVFLLLALTIPISFELNFILKLWLGNNIPEYTYIFTQLVLWTNVIELCCNVINMPFGAIGIMKLGNIIGGGLQIIALPIGYIFLKFGYPPESVFVIILFTVIAKTIFMWIHTYNLLNFKWKDAFNIFIAPVIFVCLLSLVVPIILNTTLEEGWFRFIILLLLSEFFLLMVVWFIGLTKDERLLTFNYIRRKINL